MSYMGLEKNKDTEVCSHALYLPASMTSNLRRSTHRRKMKHCR